MVSCGSALRSASWYIFDYETPKLVTIRSLRVGITNRVIQILILAYIIGYAIVYKKGYQDSDTAESGVVAKLKGVSSSLNRLDLPPEYRRIWDVGDFHIPAQENSAFFVLTNAILSVGQRQGVCPEDPGVEGASCNSSLHCTPGLVIGNGWPPDGEVEENSAFFVLTNAILSVGQRQGVCPEDPGVEGASCNSSLHCTPGLVIENGWPPDGEVEENSAFFVLTNAILSVGQRQGVCPEDPGVEGASCNSSLHCTPGLVIGNGWPPDGEVEENSAFFVLTNAILSVGQRQGVCPEDPGVEGASCNSSLHCTPGLVIGNGWPPDGEVEENSAFFVLTNAILSVGQRQGVCPEDPGVEGASCNSSLHCTPGLVIGNGWPPDGEVEENSAFFVLTNAILSVGQRQGVCPEDPGVEGASCNSSLHCTPGLVIGNGWPPDGEVEENSAFFVLTNAILSVGQRQGVCPEDPGVEGASCNSSLHCTPGLVIGNGWPPDGEVEENSAFFVLTNAILSVGQRQGVCPEDPGVEGASCNSSLHCTPGLVIGNGWPPDGEVEENSAFFVLTNAILSVGQRQGVCPEDPGVEGASCNSSLHCTPGLVIGNGWPPDGEVEENSAFFVLTNAILSVGQRQGVCPEDPGVEGASCNSSLHCTPGLVIGNGWPPDGEVEENSAFFVLTNAILSVGQRQGVCPEDPGVEGASCNSSLHCTPGLVIGNGVETGECNETTSTCAIQAWCPVEIDQLEKPLEKEALLDGAVNFTVLIKNYISFPKFSARRRNIVDRINNHTYLSKPCMYNNETDPLCPIFRIGDIVRYAGSDFASLAITGGVIGIRISWDCNLDWNIENCLPRYEFTRLDNPKVQVAKGWNFRTAEHYSDGGVAKRNLMKAYGILFVVSVEGRAGRFSFVPLLLNIGSGLALLTLATVIGDIVLLYLHRRRKYFYDKKYLKIVDDDFAKFASMEQSGIENEIYEEEH